MVLFDNDYLSFLLRENPGIVDDPQTGKPVENIKAKIEHLIDTLSKSREKIVIPTPVLTEILVGAGSAASDILMELTDTYSFEIAPFDMMAAVECAVQIASARQAGDKKGGSSKDWPHIKFDRQILAIAKAKQVRVLYSNDEDIRRWGPEVGVTVIPVWELPPAPAQQQSLLTLMESQSTEAKVPEHKPPSE